MERTKWTKERAKAAITQTGWNYQTLAARTIPEYSSPEKQKLHAMFGITAEIQEACDAYYVYCNHEHYDEAQACQHFYRELGDICWMCAEMFSSTFDTPMNEEFDAVFRHADDVFEKYEKLLHAIKIPAVFDELRKHSSTLASYFQHYYQGRPLNNEYIGRSLLDILADVAVLAAYIMEKQGQIGITPEAALDTVFIMNIDKLRKRYPGAGWDLEHDINRAEDDT